MHARVTLVYTHRDLAAAILRDVPTDDASLSLYRSIGSATPELFAVVRIPGGQEGLESAAWIPSSWSARSGDALILHIDHATISDIIVTHARELVVRLFGSVCSDAAELRVTPDREDIPLEVTFHVPGAAHAAEEHRLCVSGAA